MIDIGLSKMALIGAVALIVIGPEKLPRVARTVGTLLGKAQRYVSDVKAEVNRSMELDELRKMNAEGKITGCVVDGPLSMDIAIDPEAAHHKGAQDRPAAGHARDGQEAGCAGSGNGEGQGGRGR